MRTIFLAIGVSVLVVGAAAAGLGCGDDDASVAPASDAGTNTSSGIDAAPESGPTTDDGSVAASFCASRVPAPTACVDFDGAGALEDTLAPFHIEKSTTATATTETAVDKVASSPRALRLESAPAGNATTAKLVGSFPWTGHFKLAFATRVESVGTKGDLLVFRAFLFAGTGLQAQLHVKPDGSAALEAGTQTLTSTPLTAPLSLGAWHRIEIDIQGTDSCVIAVTVDGQPAANATIAPFSSASPKIIVENGVIKLLDQTGVDGAALDLDDVWVTT